MSAPLTESRSRKLLLSPGANWIVPNTADESLSSESLIPMSNPSGISEPEVDSTRTSPIQWSLA